MSFSMYMACVLVSNNSSGIKGKSYTRPLTIWKAMQTGHSLDLLCNFFASNDTWVRVREPRRHLQVHDGNVEATLTFLKDVSSTSVYTGPALGLSSTASKPEHRPSFDLASMVNAPTPAEVAARRSTSRAKGIPAAPLSNATTFIQSDISDSAAIESLGSSPQLQPSAAVFVPAAANVSAQGRVHDQTSSYSRYNCRRFVLQLHKHCLAESAQKTEGSRLNYLVDSLMLCQHNLQCNSQVLLSSCLWHHFFGCSKVCERIMHLRLLICIFCTSIIQTEGPHRSTWAWLWSSEAFTRLLTCDLGWMGSPCCSSIIKTS